MDPLLLAVELGTTSGDLWYALFLCFGILTFAWAKGKIGDAKAALIVTLLLALIFWNHPNFIWLFGGIFLYITFGKEIFKV